MIVENIVEALGGLQLTVRQLAEGVECTGIHSSYVTGVTSVCSNCLTGIVIMMGISAAIAIAFSCGVVMMSRVPVVDGAAEAYDHQRGRTRGNDTDPLVDSSYMDSFCVYREGKYARWSTCFNVLGRTLMGAFRSRGKGPAGRSSPAGTSRDGTLLFVFSAFNADARARLMTSRRVRLWRH